MMFLHFFTHIHYSDGSFQHVVLPKSAFLWMCLVVDPLTPCKDIGFSAEFPSGQMKVKVFSIDYEQKIFSSRVSLRYPTFC